MAVTSTFVSKDLRRYVGTSADAKPTEDPAASDGVIPLGSQFVERDTRREYEWQGDGWVLRSGLEIARVEELLHEQSTLLRQLVTGLSLLTDTDLASTDT